VVDASKIGHIFEKKLINKKPNRGV